MKKKYLPNEKPSKRNDLKVSCFNVDIIFECEFSYSLLIEKMPQSKTSRWKIIKTPDFCQDAVIEVTPHENQELPLVFLSGR